MGAISTVVFFALVIVLGFAINAPGLALSRVFRASDKLTKRKLRMIIRATIDNKIDYQTYYGFSSNEIKENPRYDWIRKQYNFILDDKNNLLGDLKIGSKILLLINEEGKKKLIQLLSEIEKTD